MDNPKTYFFERDGYNIYPHIPGTGGRATYQCTGTKSVAAITPARGVYDADLMRTYEKPAVSGDVVNAWCSETSSYCRIKLHSDMAKINSRSIYNKNG